MRVMFVEDAEFRGTFYSLDKVRFVSAFNEYEPRDRYCTAPYSLRHLDIHLDDIRAITNAGFPVFDELRSWTPISTDTPLIRNHVAFGPTEDVALVVQLAENDLVETMHFHMWHVENEQSIIPLIVQLFVQIAERWELLLETLTTQQVVAQDESMMTSCVNKLLAGG